MLKTMSKGAIMEQAARRRLCSMSIVIATDSGPKLQQSKQTRALCTNTKESPKTRQEHLDLAMHTYTCSQRQEVGNSKPSARKAINEIMKNIQCRCCGVHVIFISGPPGAGKSTIGRELKEYITADRENGIDLFFMGVDRTMCTNEHAKVNYFKAYLKANEQRKKISCPPHDSEEENVFWKKIIVDAQEEEIKKIAEKRNNAVIICIETTRSQDNYLSKLRKQGITPNYVYQIFILRPREPRITSQKERFFERDEWVQNITRWYNENNDNTTSKAQYVANHYPKDEELPYNSDPAGVDEPRCTDVIKMICAPCSEGMEVTERAEDAVEPTYFFYIFDSGSKDIVCRCSFERKKNEECLSTSCASEMILAAGSALRERDLIILCKR